MHEPTVADIVAKLRAADADEFAVLQRLLVADMRKGVRNAVAAAEKRLAAEAAEAARLEGLYAFEREVAAEKCGCAGEDRGAFDADTLVILGLDEVGRGPLAGPLAVGGVVFAADAARLAGLNDSKQVKPERREQLAEEIKREALAWDIEYIPPEDIDAHGMTASLKMAFGKVIHTVESAGIVPDVILLDGNPLRMDTREANLIKGDSQCASIAAASIIAKVARDALMVGYQGEYPMYDFASNKGYASPQHIAAIKEHGLSPIHRRSFCMSFTQETLF